MEPEPPNQDEKLLKLAIGNFTLTKVLGRGGMGTVYLAEHRSISRRKAVKVLSQEAAASPSKLRRFYDEAAAASQCQHDHIVVIEDCGSFVFEDRVHHYLEMEFLDGLDLGTACREASGNRMADVDRAVRIIEQAAGALAAAHARGVIHRDVKPENLFLATRAGRIDFVKVLDFGVARLMGELAQGPRTRTGELLGTPLYMSPEQAAGHRVDGKTDVWSLGVVLYRVLAGVPPFYSDTFVPLAAKIQQDDPPPLEQLRPDVPPGVLRAVAAALRKEASRRPSMDAWRELLHAADAAPRVVLPERSLKPSRGNKQAPEPPRPPMVVPSSPPAATPSVLPFSLTGPIPGPPPPRTPRPAPAAHDDEPTQPGAPLALVEPQYTSAYGSRKAATAAATSQPAAAPRRARQTPHMVPPVAPDSSDGDPPPLPAMPRPRRRTR